MNKENKDKEIVYGTGRFSHLTFGVGKIKKPTNVLGANPNSIDWCCPVESEDTKLDTQDKEKEV